MGYELANKFQPLRTHLYGHNRRTRKIAARPVETRDKSSLNWIATDSEDDRYGGRRRLAANGDGSLTADQLSSQLGQPIVLTFSPAILDCDVLTFEIAGLPQTLAAGTRDSCRLGWRPSTRNHWSAKRALSRF
jgi:hypothetical protein